MRRREFIAGLGSAATWPLAARGQQPGKMWRIGYLTTLTNDAYNTFGGFLQGMRDSAASRERTS
jgi:putative tryptophan/tyrosine transport system substrate-binding protein